MLQQTPGSASGTTLIIWSSDIDTVACLSDMVLGGGKMRPPLVGGSVRVGVMGSSFMVTRIPTGGWIEEGDGEGVVILTLLALVFLLKMAATEWPAQADWVIR